MLYYSGIIDGFNLTVTAIVAIGSQLLFGLATFALRKEYLADIGVAITVMAVAFLACFGGTLFSRSIAAMTLVVCWAFWIGAFHLTRILKAGGRASRFDEMRGHLPQTMLYFLGQGVWIWVTLIPLTIVCSPRGSYPGEGGAYLSFGTSRDLAGIVIFSFGFVYEMISDVHRDLWQQRHGRDQATVQSGLWALSRHANMFGRWVMWWGLYIIAIGAANDSRASASARAALYASVVGPLANTVVILFMNVREAESLAARRAYATSTSVEPNAWANYQASVSQTSLFLPCPRALYSVLPQGVKSTVFLDLKAFRFDSGREGAVVIAEERRKQSEELAGPAHV